MHLSLILPLYLAESQRVLEVWEAGAEASLARTIPMLVQNRVLSGYEDSDHVDVSLRPESVRESPGSALYFPHPPPAPSWPMQGQNPGIPAHELPVPTPNLKNPGVRALRSPGCNPIQPLLHF